MLKKILLAGILLLVIGSSFSLKCTKDLQGTTGTCITSTYTAKATGNTIYKACSSFIESYWWYYEPCTATVSDLSITTDTGEYVANAWSNNDDYVSACNGRDAWLCNVNALFGVQTNTLLNYVGRCDSSESNCVKCNGRIESSVFDGGLDISGAGDTLCESGCGAAGPCDEVTPNSWSNNPNATSSPFEAHCSSVCLMDDTRCRLDFGAHAYCDYQDPGYVCNTDYCDSQNRLVDFNGNALNDSVTCQADCSCDDTPDTLLCDTLCGANPNCHRLVVGYNNGTAGCNDICNWLECGLFAWNITGNTCYTSCATSAECYSPSVCDLVGAGVNTCVNDLQAPIVSLITPVNDSRFNNGSISYSFNVTDNADNTLNCYYSLNNANTSVGVVNHGDEYDNNLVLSVEDWYNLYYYCIDEANNTGYSNITSILFDESTPTYSGFNFQDVTWTVDDTLIDGDVVRVFADWTDNFELDYSELMSDFGGWHVEQTIYHSSSANQSSFYFNTSGHGGETLQFRIRTYDTAGNNNVTGIVNVNVLTPNNTIKVVMRESGGNVTNRLEFLGSAQSASNVQATDTGSSALLGDFLIEHIGLGTSINNTMSVSAGLPAGIQIKVSGDNNPAGAVYLTATPTVMPFCFNMTPTDQCEVWVWMDLASAVPPQLEVNSIKVESETI